MEPGALILKSKKKKNITVKIRLRIATLGRYGRFLPGPTESWRNVPFVSTGLIRASRKGKGLG
jgi:hypothetical protein